jgi:AAA domain
MFSVANAIAYQNKMIFGLAERLPAGDAAPFYGDSAWIDISGRVAGRQTVPEQTAFVAQLLGATYAEFRQLPDLYVISPFKEVKENLIRSIRQSRTIWGEAARPLEGKLGNWLQAPVGTVHTFQGKEEDTVIMVLGVDAQTQGAARWAASKPNILNVALTRAKRRFYMVGDRNLWTGQQFFSDAARALPTVTQWDFMHRISASWYTRSCSEEG